MLNRQPMLTVMLGPPSSGKTALVRHVVEQRNENGPLFHPLQIDLRGADMKSDSLYRKLFYSTKTLFQNLIPGEFKLEVRGCD